MSLLHDVVTWTVEWTERVFTPLGAWGLFILAFIESSFFPIPPDILLIILVSVAPEQFLFLAFICTLGSVLGALFGYGIGYYGGLPLLKKIVKEDKIKNVHRIFEKYEGWAVGIAGLTPIPYKVATVAGGVFYVDLKKFIIASFLSRGLRYLIIAWLVFQFGEPVKIFIDEYFDILSILGVVVLVVGYFGWKWWKKPKKQHTPTKND